ncbi:cardiolipin synthase [Staphylococcus carnosus]|uniref:cardiolipin synthase n=1 Tax=Staphylococcus carnosus TaxID=1281 RepID=UPI00081AA806|nr:cardiolipin synthase [Staphylococcus carnosus]ANZ33468.1 cardiolipin synthase [Staphylococcus carnosus]UTB85632.1 cardiolipin synthase [Staphylococcus carnosus]
MFAFEVPGLFGDILTGIFILFTILNLIVAFTIIFIKDSSTSSTWAWLFILFIAPVLGFFLYILFGRGVSKNKLYKNYCKDIEEFENILNEQRYQVKHNNLQTDNEIVEKHHDLVNMLLTRQPAFLTEDNDVEIFVDGHKLYDKMIEDILQAKNHIHLEYYTFELDGLGHRIIDALEQKLEEGVEVLLLYDDLGSKNLSIREFKRFRKLGGQVESFFASKLPLINFRANNRNHRKIVVIDGEVGYIGGFNIGDEYLGLSKKFGYWRDTHARIKGNAVDALQLRFIMDWNSQSKREHLKLKPAYFPVKDEEGDVSIQIASSGPDDTWHEIEFGYTKMINSARNSIYMQSPYFIPDNSYINAIKMAANSGVDVHLMIPDMPDHPFVYWATYYHAAELLDAGVKIYTYNNGFIHSKVMVIDDEVASVGSANMDFRSFELNFEVNAFMYNKDIAVELRKAFEHDVTLSTQLTKSRYAERSNWIKLKEGFSKLITPIL